MVGCASTAPTTPSAPPAAAAIDVLDFVVGDQALWPRIGDQYQHQTVAGSHVCWTKYTLPWMYECWRWDEAWVYHEVDHGIDARRWEYYTLSDGRWLPRRLPVDSEDEFGVLARGYNRMADELQDLYTSLEQRVEHGPQAFLRAPIVLV